MTRLILVFAGLLFCGSIGAFFLFVPPLLIAGAWFATVLLLWAAFVLLIRSGTPDLQPAPPLDLED